MTDVVFAPPWLRRRFAGYLLVKKVNSHPIA
jgi:hypothetical protein